LPREFLLRSLSERLSVGGLARDAVSSSTVFAKWSSRLGGSVFFSRSSSSTVGVGAAGAASRVGSLDLDVSRATA
jgi:hypothetical protein